MSTASIVTLCIPIALLGTFWGLTDRLVVYHGSQDLLLTAIGYASAIATLVASSHSATVTIVLLLITTVIMLVSLADSKRANGSFIKACIAVPTKFMLLFLIIILGLAATGGLQAAYHEQKKGNARAAAKNAAVGAGGSLGAYFVAKLIRKLIKTRVATT